MSARDGGLAAQGVPGALAGVILGEDDLSSTSRLMPSWRAR